MNLRKKSEMTNLKKGFMLISLCLMSICLDKDEIDVKKYFSK